MITTINARRANTIIITAIIMIVVLEPPNPDDAFVAFITAGFVTVGVIVAEVVAPTCIKTYQRKLTLCTASICFFTLYKIQKINRHFMKQIAL